MTLLDMVLIVLMVALIAISYHTGYCDGKRAKKRGH